MTMQLLTSQGTIDLSTPLVMGILNLTPDSFYDGGHYTSEQSWLDQVGKMLDEGAGIIDIGGVSTRPGSEGISSGEELDRVLPAVEKLAGHFPQAILSIDTYRSEVADACITAGAHIINDVSGGCFDERMFPLVARLGAPYILMHMKGTPRDMQRDPSYKDVVGELTGFFTDQLNKLRDLGVRDNVVIDPGFGFGKNTIHNFQLLRDLSSFRKLGCPVMAGVSRKSMVNRILGTKPANALNGSTVIHTLALLNGANILRTHDVREAVEAVKLVTYYNSIQQ